MAAVVCETALLRKVPVGWKAGVLASWIAFD
jgi:hypothetical protein